MWSAASRGDVTDLSGGVLGGIFSGNTSKSLSDSGLADPAD